MWPAELAEEARLSKDGGDSELLERGEAAGGWKKAQPFTVVMLLALEDGKLLKVWAALRWSDAQGVPNELLRLRPDSVLEGRITRSKTSGQGKKVKERR